jgi:hypothetical protein
MKPELLKPIPKYILDKIRKTDKAACPAQSGLRFYSYLTKMRRELVKVTVAVRNRYKNWHYKQVAAHGVKSDECWVKDMEYVYFGMGYRVGWHAEGLARYAQWYEDGEWHSAGCKYYNPYSTLVNLDCVGRFPEYRYSAYQCFQGKCIIEYLKLYGQYPQAEYLLKLGLSKVHGSVTVLKRIAKDKAFCKWLIANRDEIALNHYYVGTVMKAYKTGKPFKDIQRFEEQKKRFDLDPDYRPIKDLFKGRDLERFFSYLEKQNAKPRSYLDYLRACGYLGLDMSLEKHRFPHNFKRWHDIRIDQYGRAKALADGKERAELYGQFAAVAEKYAALQKIEKEGYAMIIAASPGELIREGEVLRHCVGRMNYDLKMARGETLIFFVRDGGNPGVPFVTVEYSPKSKKVLQCYGYGNSKPADEVLAFIHEVWLPYANRTIKKIAA